MFKSKFFSMLMAVALVCASASLASCSSDDDEPAAGGNAVITIDGKTVKFSHAGYMRADDGDFALVFSNFDMASGKVPSKMSALIIDVYGQGTKIPTGTFQPSNYDLTVMVDYNYETEKGYYLEENERECGPLTITENNGVYTVSCPQLAVEGEKDGDYNNQVKFTTSFEHSGKLKFYDVDYE